MLGPQGTLFFLLLVMVFAGLMAWLIITKQLVLRVFAAVLAFIPAMVFGVATVNRYYDYYQSWGSLFSDLSGQSAQSVPQLSAASLGRDTGKSVSSLLGSTNAALDSSTGYLFRTMVTGPKSHITREVYVYLPPQYFSKAYANYQFPAIELLHGSPGQPETWVNVMNVIPMYLQELSAHQARPAVLVMPDTDGGLQYEMQCLNDPGGLQDMTFVGQEIPRWARANLRVQPPGPTWGVAGYSEGGFCAANVALQDANFFGYAGSLSGYFAPVTSRVPARGEQGAAPVNANVFAHRPALLERNSPERYILNVPLTERVPQFYLAAGALDPADVNAAQYFRQLLLTRVAQVSLTIVPGGGHQATVWRAALRPMLAWMTTQLALAEQRSAVNARNAAGARARHAHQPVRGKRPHPLTVLPRPTGLPRAAGPGGPAVPPVT